MHENVARLLAGIVLLVFGRKLFWLLVGVLGFLTGMMFAEKFLHGQSHLVVLIVAVGAGLLGAVLAIFLQKLAIVVAGFLAGGYLATILMTAFQLHFAPYDWVPLLVGAIIGAVFGMMLFDWALILFSSVTGALLVAQFIHARAAVQGVLFLVLLIAGIAIQSGFKRKEPPPE